MKTTLRPTASLKPYERNPRINDQAVAAVAESIHQFGFRQPIVVDAKGVIIVGHVRWKAAKKLGLARVPVHVATDLTPEQVRAYRLVDNKSAELAEWNLSALAAEFADLPANLDLLQFGFTAEDLNLPESKRKEAEAPGETESPTRFSILIDCADETQQTRLLKRFQKEGLTCKAYVL